VKPQRVADKLRRFYHYYPGAVAVIGVKDKKNGANFMPAVWNTGLSFDPPLFGVAVSPKRHTYGLLREGRPYSVSFFPFEKAELVARLGSVSGAEVNKVEAFGLQVFWGEVLEVPLLKGAFAAYELEPAGRFQTGDHDLFVGRVRAVWEAEGAFNEHGALTPDRVEALLYFGRFTYGKPARETKFLKFK